VEHRTSDPTEENKKNNEVASRSVGITAGWIFILRLRDNGMECPFTVKTKSVK